MKSLSVDGTKALVFVVVFIGMVTLIALDKLPAENLKYLLMWLLPGPLTLDDKTKTASEENEGK